MRKKLSRILRYLLSISESKNITIVFRRINNFYWKYIASPTAYAKHIGVNIIGKNNYIATKKWSSEPFLITIGDNCFLTGDVTFHTHGGSHGARRIDPDFETYGKIVVEDNVYIGSNSTILPGVTICEGVVVAACSVVTKSIPPRVVVAGNPARIVCTIDEFIQKGQKYNLKTGRMPSKEKMAFLKTLPEEAFIKKRWLKQD